MQFYLVFSLYFMYCRCQFFYYSSLNISKYVSLVCSPNRIIISNVILLFSEILTGIRIYFFYTYGSHVISGFVCSIILSPLTGETFWSIRTKYSYFVLWDVDESCRGQRQAKEATISSYHKEKDKSQKIGMSIFFLG